MNELPARHVGITISGPTIGRLSARVEEVDAGGRMRLAGVAGNVGDHVHVRWISSRGAAEVPCAIEAGESPGSCWLRPVGPPTIDQRRRYFRIDVAMPVNIELNAGSKPLQAWAVDLSEGGVRAVTVDVDFVAGQRVFIAFDLDSGAHIEGDAEVLRSAPDGDGFSTIVLTFGPLPDIMRDRIRQFVFKSQMRAGARA